MQFGKTQQEKNYADMTYKYFLSQIAKRLGYDLEKEVDKADLFGKNSASLAQNYLTKIAESELVIADLSGNSASVYYELGVRHALVPSRTIILAPQKCQDGTDFQPAFDVENDHYIYRYNSDHRVEVMDAEVERISKEIQKSINDSPTIVDSPIFHHIPDMSSFQERTQTKDQQIEVLKNKINQLETELSEIKRGGMAKATERGSIDIDFDAAKQEQTLYGSEILKSLLSISRIESEPERERRIKQEEDAEQFIKILHCINNNDFIDARTFRKIASLCIERNLTPYAQRILECGLSRYPYDDDIRFDLIDLYHASESAQLRQRAVEYCEQYYYIEIDKENNAHFTAKSIERPFTHNRLVSLFNSYIGIDDYRRLSCITDSLLEIVDLDDPRCLALLPRNKAVAEMEQGHYRVAVDLFVDAYHKDPSEQTISLLANTCYKAGKKEVGFLLREFLVSQEPEEAERYIKLVNAVIQYECIRIGVHDDGTPRFESIGVTLRPYEKYLIPLLYRAMVCDICDEGDQQNINDLLTTVFKTKAAQEALEFFLDVSNSSQWKKDNYQKKKESTKDSLDFSLLESIETNTQKMSDPGNANQEIIKIFNRLNFGEDS